MKKFYILIPIILLMSACSKQPKLEDNPNYNYEPYVKESSYKKPIITNKENSVENKDNLEIEDKTIPTENINLNEEMPLQNEDNLTTKTTIKKVDKDLAHKISQIVVYFDFDKYNIKSSELPKIEKLASLIKNNKGHYIVRIEGNCDEWGSEEYNYALGLKRANVVKDALIQLGVNPDKLSLISYGELNPVCTAHAAWCWKENRRDNFTYIP